MYKHSWKHHHAQICSVYCVVNLLTIGKPSQELSYVAVLLLYTKLLLLEYNQNIKDNKCN